MSRTSSSSATVVAVIALTVFALGYPLRVVAAVPSEDGVALEVVYDTSGSMRETVPDGAGGRKPKYQMAIRALDAIVDRLQFYVTNAPATAPRKLQFGLVTFGESSSKQAIPFGDFKVEGVRARMKTLASPDGGTPLGQAVAMAWRTVLASNLTKKHVIVVTDGENTVGPDPAATLPALREQAVRQGAAVSVHFVAFDVDAKVFGPLKKQDVTVVGAANAKELDARLQDILERKILLEEEEPPKAAGR